MKISLMLKFAAFCLAATTLTAVGPAFAGDIGACLITKADTNPSFIKMKGVTLMASK